MRDYGTVHTSFWTSSTTRSLSDDARILALYLLSGPHTTSIGCFRLPDGYVSEDLGWSPERVSEGFAELFNNSFATRDERSKWVLIHKFLRWNEIENPNQGKAAGKLFDQVPAGALKDQLCQSISEFSPKFPTEILNRYETLGEPLHKPSKEPFRNQEQEQEQEQLSLSEIETTSDQVPKPKARKPYPAKFEEFWSAYPVDPNMSKSEAGKAWERLTAEDREKAIRAIPAFREYCRKHPDYRPVHAVRYLTHRRFDGFAEQAPAAGSNGAGQMQRQHDPMIMARIFVACGNWQFPEFPEPGKSGSPVTAEMIAAVKREEGEKAMRMVQARDREDAA